MLETTPRRRAVTVIELLVLLAIPLILLAGPVLGALCWPYVVNTWLVYAEKPAGLLRWHGALMGVIPPFGYLSIPAAILTWIMMMFLA